MGKADLIIAADFGTTGVKLGAVRRDMSLVAGTVVPYPLHLPSPSRAEQNPGDWWRGLARAMTQLSKEIPDLADRAAAIVFCAQMAGLVCADAGGEPLRPALVWLDKRAAPLMPDLLGGWPRIAGYSALKLAAWVRLTNGAPSHNGMDPIGKMVWMRDNEPAVFEKSARLLDVKDWLVHRATGRFITTADSANLTWLMDTRKGKEGWSPALARRAGLPLGKLPDIIDGSEVVGGLTEAAANEIGLPTGLPVVAGGGDVTATALGSGAVEDGALHIALSSSAWVSGFFNRRVLSVRHSYATITSAAGRRPLLIATQESAGSALHWLAQTMGAGQADTDAGLAAFYAKPGDLCADDPHFLPWLAGERVPVDEERLRGCFMGLSLRHGTDALKRAVIDGVAQNTAWAFAKVAAERGAAPAEVIPLVGGAARNPHLAQALADALGRPVQVGHTVNSGVLGAAALATPAAGWTGTPWEAAKLIKGRDGPIYHPRPEQSDLIARRKAELARIRPALIKLYKSGGNRAQ